MKLKIPKNYFNQTYVPPRVFLCTVSGKVMGELPAYEISLSAKWNSYSEISFSIDRQYTDILTGETKVHPLFDKAESLRQVLIENMGYFILQDTDATYNEKDTKNLSAFSLEYAASTKYLENFLINTGDVNSQEVLYNEKIHGTDYIIDKDNLYKKSIDNFDPSESYYIKDYIDKDSYTWTQVQIKDESHYATYDGSTVAKTLYVKNYPNVRFYYPANPELSLVHLVLEKIPEWKIGNVDVSLWRKERKFEEDRISVYDFLMNEVCDTFKCVCEWDALTKTVSFYEEAEDGINEDNTIQSKFNTDVYISRENLASQIDIKVSADNIKTKLKVSGAEDLDIREVNLGNNYIINLDFYHGHIIDENGNQVPNYEWMEQDVYEAYDKYLDAVEKYRPEYTEVSQKRAKAYDKVYGPTGILYAIPAEGNVILVGDMFEKLYCIYTPIDTAYLNITVTNSNLNGYVDNLYSDKECIKTVDKTFLSDKETFVVQGYQYIYYASTNNFKCERNILTTTAIENLKKKLTLYHVDEDITAQNSDNILLRLRNKDSDTAIIRVYNTNTKESPNYKIESVITKADITSIDEGYEKISTYELSDWLKGNLTISDKMNNLDGFKITSIGTLGAYLCLAKDETVEANLEDYGIEMLKEKQEIYMTIFQTQTERLFSSEEYQCVASNTAPSDTKSKWLDTSGDTPLVKEYNGTQWVDVSKDLKNYENYVRYTENREKLLTVQKVLAKKRKEGAISF